MAENSYDMIIDAYLNDLARANHRAILAEAAVQQLQKEIQELRNEISQKIPSEEISDAS